MLRWRRSINKSYYILRFTVRWRNWNLEFVSFNYWWIRCCWIQKARIGSPTAEFISKEKACMCAHPKEAWIISEGGWIKERGRKEAERRSGEEKEGGRKEKESGREEKERKREKC